jgi:hypothetical protein
MFIRNYDCQCKCFTESKDRLNLSDYTCKIKKSDKEGKPITLTWYDGIKKVATILTDTEPASDGYKWFGSFEVYPEYRRRGLGDQIIKLITSKYGAGALAVLKTNKPAINLYKKNGFKISKERLDDKYYYMYLEKNKVSTITESYNDLDSRCKYVRVTYSGSKDGIYEAYKKHATKSQWVNFLNSKACKWLKKPDVDYGEGYESYFTLSGYQKFCKYTLPELVKVLGEDEIITHKINTELKDKYDVVYKDSDQIVISK